MIMRLYQYCVNNDLINYEFFGLIDRVNFTNNLRMPDSDDFFHGASSGSNGKGPCTGGSSSIGLKFFNN